MGSGQPIPMMDLADNFESLLDNSGKLFGRVAPLVPWVCGVFRAPVGTLPPRVVPTPKRFPVGLVVPFGSGEGERGSGSLRLELKTDRTLCTTHNKRIWTVIRMLSEVKG